MARENKRKRDERRFGVPERLADLIPRGPEGWDGVPFEATNISDYYIKFMETNNSLSFCDDIPCVRLPFPEIFIEMVRENLGGMRVGWRLFDISPDNPLARHTWELNDGRDDYGRGWTHAVSGCLFLAWKATAYKPVGLCVYHIDSHGRLACNPSFQLTGDFGSLPVLDPLFFLQETLVPVLLALSFISCKNVTIESRDPDPAINRERRKHARIPFVRYHTINIEPMKKVLKTEGGIETNGLKRALHICRGHFATYTEEKPLFGRKAGTFWIPAHTRGSLDQGIIVSDYNVHPPKE